MNYLYKSQKNSNVYYYTFELGFDHNVSSEKIAKVFDQVFEQYSRNFQKKPSYMLVRSGAFERVYMVYLYVENPESIFILRQQVAEVFKRWDMERMKK